MSSTNKDLWVFGYGSLIWKVDFPYVEKKTGYIKGFLRRFYQNSIDHRGTICNPGRVVTLIPSSDSNSIVWGMCYRINKNDEEKVLEHLDCREQNGYVRYSIKFYPKTFDGNSREKRNEEAPIDIILYLAPPDNVSYAGDTDFEKLVEQIYNAEGKSGTNREYIYKLADAMRLLYPGQDDDHLFQLEKLLKIKEYSLKNHNLTS